MSQDMSLSDLEAGGPPPTNVSTPRQELQAGIFRMTTAVSTFQRLVDSIGTPTCTPDVREELDKTRSDIRQLAYNNTARLMELKEFTGATASEKVGDANLAKDLRAVLKEFQQAQRIVEEHEIACAVQPSSSVGNDLELQPEENQENLAEKIAILFPFIDPMRKEDMSSNNEAGGPPPTNVTTSRQALQAGIFRMNTSVSTYQRLVGSIGTPKYTPEVSEKLDKTRLHIGELAHQNAATLRELQQFTDVSASEKVGDAKLAKDFQAVLKEFQKADKIVTEHENAFAVQPSRGNEGMRLPYMDASWPPPTNMRTRRRALAAGASLVNTSVLRFKRFVRHIGPPKYSPPVEETSSVENDHTLQPDESQDYLAEIHAEQRRQEILLLDLIEDFLVLDDLIEDVPVDFDAIESDMEKSHAETIVTKRRLTEAVTSQKSNNCLIYVLVAIIAVLLLIIVVLIAT